MPDEGRYLDLEAKQWQLRLTPGAFEVIDKLDPIVIQKDCTLAQLSLAWVLEQPGVTSPIIGPRTLEQLEDNLGAIDVPITADDLSKIDEIVPAGSNVSPFYEADFSTPLYRW
jgi:aryl-alcohol dehydrogenase-like predicted oxidoreductase